MKRKLTSIICLFLMSCIFIGSREKDGDRWNSFSKEEKQLFYAGYLNGHLSILEMINETILIYDNITIKEADSEAEKDKLRKYKMGFLILAGYIKENLVASQRISHTQLFEGVDDFYEDYANKHIRHHHAFEIVKKRISGTDEVEIQDLVKYYRKIDSKK